MYRKNSALRQETVVCIFEIINILDVATWMKPTEMKPRETKQRDLSGLQGTYFT